MDSTLPQEVVRQRRDALARRRRVQTVLVKLAVIVVVVLAITKIVFGITIVSGAGMYPRASDGDVLIYYRLEANYHIRDVVVTEFEGGTYVNRIVAQGGDVVDMTEDGTLLINSYEQNEEIFYPTKKDGSAITYPYTVPGGSYFLLGDLRTNAYDSRSFGAVAEEDLAGKAFTIIRRTNL